MLLATPFYDRIMRRFQAARLMNFCDLDKRASCEGQYSESGSWTVVDTAGQ